MFFYIVCFLQDYKIIFNNINMNIINYLFGNGQDGGRQDGIKKHIATKIKNIDEDEAIRDYEN